MKELTHLEQQKQRKETQKRRAGTISIFVFYCQAKPSQAPAPAQLAGFS